eukprot:3507440-Rhodomonas_salina.1
MRLACSCTARLSAAVHSEKEGGGTSGRGVLRVGRKFGRRKGGKGRVRNAEREGRQPRFVPTGGVKGWGKWVSNEKWEG